MEECKTLATLRELGCTSAEASRRVSMAAAERAPCSLEIAPQNEGRLLGEGWGHSHNAKAGSSLSLYPIKVSAPE